MGIRLSDEEAWAKIESSHTGILTTLTRTGWPISLPTWFAVLDRRVYLRTPNKAKKLARIRNDDRGCFLVESGERWAELAAVMLSVKVSAVTDPEIDQAVASLLDTKYKGYRTSRSTMPEATKSHYSGATLLRLDPCGQPVTWDNSRLRLEPSPA